MKTFTSLLFVAICLTVTIPAFAVSSDAVSTKTEITLVGETKRATVETTTVNGLHLAYFKIGCSCGTDEWPGPGHGILVDLNEIAKLAGDFADVNETRKNLEKLTLEYLTIVPTVYRVDGSAPCVVSFYNLENVREVHLPAIDGCDAAPAMVPTRFYVLLK